MVYEPNRSGFSRVWGTTLRSRRQKIEGCPHSAGVIGYSLRALKPTTLSFKGKCLHPQLIERWINYKRGRDPPLRMLLIRSSFRCL